MSNLIPELSGSKSKNVSTTDDTTQIRVPENRPPAYAGQPQPAPVYVKSERQNTCFPTCFGCCLGIFTTLFLISVAASAALFFFARESPSAFDSEFTPQARLADRYETAYAVGVQQATTSQTFCIRVTEDEFASYLNFEYNRLVKEELLDLLLAQEIGDLRLRMTLRDLYFQAEFEDSELRLFAETKVVGRFIILGFRMDSEVMPSGLARTETQLPLVVNITRFQIGPTRIEPAELENNIETDLAQVIIELLDIPYNYVINTITIDEGSLSLIGYTTLPEPNDLTPFPTIDITLTPNLTITPLISQPCL